MRVDPSIALWAHDRAFATDGRVLCGVDEVGRGPLAGNVVAACAIFRECDLTGGLLPGLNDSKKLTPAKREALAPRIRECALAWSIGEATPEEIDQINILQATFLAMRRALEKIQAMDVQPSLLLVDGNQKIPGIALPQTTVVKGDALSASIAAASVLAKVHRDLSMQKAETAFPGYGFAAHKGYGTAEHTQAILRLGLTPLHRQSFCRNFDGIPA